MYLIAIYSGVFVFSVTLGLIMLFAILGMRMIRKIRSKCNLRFKKVVEAILVSSLKNEDSFFNSIPRLKRILRNESQKQIIISILESLCKSFQGSFIQKIQSLYKKLRLHLTSLEKLKSTSNIVKITGIRELAAMEYKEALDSILELCKSEDATVRAEAYIASIRLSDNPLYFLDSVNTLTLWEEINVIHHLKRLPVDTILSVGNWLSSPNKAIVKFCLKIVSEFGQYDTLDQVHQLIYSKDKEIAEIAIQTIRNLRSVNSSQPVMDLVYSHDKIEIKTSAFEALLAIGISKDILHVAREFLDSPEEELRKIATRALLDFVKVDDNLPEPELAPFLPRSVA